MLDFMNHGSRDPFHYVKYSKSSFYSYAEKKEKELKNLITGNDALVLKYYSKEINNSKRVEESLLLLHLITRGKTNLYEVNLELDKLYNYKIDPLTYNSVVNNLQLNFVTENNDKKLEKVSKIYGLNTVRQVGNNVLLDTDLKNALSNKSFKNYLLDNTKYSIKKYSNDYELKSYVDGFILYRKYSRKDVFRILNWEEQPLAQNVGGYMFHNNDANCPIFVNYHKEDHISDTTKYEDGFIDNSTIIYMSKSKRKINSPDVIKFKEAQERNIRLPLFIKKQNAEGDDFYFMGDVNLLKICSQKQQ